MNTLLDNIKIVKETEREEGEEERMGRDEDKVMHSQRRRNLLNI